MNLRDRIPLRDERPRVPAGLVVSGILLWSSLGYLLCKLATLFI